MSQQTMFFPEYAKIKATDLVLEIGPGAFPDPRAHFFADKYLPQSKVDLSEFGGRRPSPDTRKVIQIPEGLRQLHSDSVDYVICSHVFEHLDDDELMELLHHINRICPRAYIEFPSYIYEKLYWFEVHKRVLTIVNGKLFTIQKERLPHDALTAEVWRRMRNENFIPERSAPSMFAEGCEFTTPIGCTVCDNVLEFEKVIKNRYGVHWKPTKRSLVFRLWWNMYKRLAVLKPVKAGHASRINEIIQNIQDCYVREWK